MKVKIVKKLFIVFVVIWALLLLFVLFTTNVKDEVPPLQVDLSHSEFVSIEENEMRCSMPKVAKFKLSEDFKYGCFCGKDHPFLPNHHQLEPLEKLRGYLAIKPMDDIDRACKNHDICWVANGAGDGQCNDQLLENLRQTDDHFMQAYRVMEEGTEVWRLCQNLSADITLAFSSLLVANDYMSFIDNIKSWLYRLMQTPTLAFRIHERWGMLQNMELSYPEYTGRCMMPIMDN